MVLSFATVSTSSLTEKKECQVYGQPAVSPLGSMMLPPLLADAPPEALPAKWLLSEGRQEHSLVSDQHDSPGLQSTLHEWASVIVVNVIRGYPDTANTCVGTLLPSPVDG